MMTIFEFYAGVVGCEAPFGYGVNYVSLHKPGGDPQAQVLACRESVPALTSGEPLAMPPIIEEGLRKAKMAHPIQIIS